jgi:hypothetical protein
MAPQHPLGSAAEEPAWVHGHAHEPNLQTPPGDGSLVVVTPGGRRHTFTPAALAQLPFTSIPDCYIVSTGHGVSGPFLFGGVRLADLLAHVLAGEPDADQGPHRSEGRSEGRSEERSEERSEYRNEDRSLQQVGWRCVDLVSADGFGTRLVPADLEHLNTGAGRQELPSPPAGPPTLAPSPMPDQAGDEPGVQASNRQANPLRPALLAYLLDGKPLTRAQGLVRLVVPSETDDALRQVKWLATITIVGLDDPDPGA